MNERSFVEQREEILAKLEQAAPEAHGKLIDDYVSILPRVAVSRCPFCDRVVEHTLDTAGLDGPWWQLNVAARGHNPPSCEHFLFLDGAVSIQKPVETARTVARIGPAVPFVIPRILEHDSVRAVVRAIPVGRHTAYPICYFGDPYPLGLELANTWGKNRHDVFTGELSDSGDRVYVWSESPVLEFEMDFELKHWVERGKLRWIAPGDSDGPLACDVARCPYLHLEGVREIVRTQDGDVWTQ